MYGLIVVYMLILHICHGVSKDQCLFISTVHLDAAQKIWDYMKVDDKVEKSDIIIGLGSYDIRVAQEAAALWHKGYADYILFSGKSGNLTRGKWRKSEAEIFKDVAVGLDVPENRILVENKSTNTGENIRFCYKMLAKLGMLPNRVILVQKPYMGRRTLATFQKQWPGRIPKVFVTSPDIDLIQYPNTDVGGLDDVIMVVLGDMQRMDHYAKSGFQTAQHIPDGVWLSFEMLFKSGLFDGHLV